MTIKFGTDGWRAVVGQDFNKEKMCGLLKFMKLEENMMINSLSKGMCEKLNLSLKEQKDMKPQLAN